MNTLTKLLSGVRVLALVLEYFKAWVNSMGYVSLVNLTSDQIFSLKRLFEKTLEFKITTFLLITGKLILVSHEVGMSWLIAMDYRTLPNERYTQSLIAS